MSEPTPGAPQPPQEPSSSWTAPPAPAAGGFQAAAVEPGPAPGIAYADLVNRIIALFIDGLILGVVYFVVLTILAVLGGWGAFIIGGVIYFVLSAAYFIYTWTRQRATYGQKFLNLETVNAADGATLTQDQAIKRWLYLWGPAAVAQVFGYSGGILLGAVGSLLALLALVYEIYLLYSASQSPKRQGYHDVQAGTVVIKRVK